MAPSRTNRKTAFAKDRANNNVSSTDAMQVPNRPLRQGENLLELWEKKAKASKKKANNVVMSRQQQ